MWHTDEKDRESARPGAPARRGLARVAWRVTLAATLALSPALLGPAGLTYVPAALAQESAGVLAVVNVADAPLLDAPDGAPVGALALGSVVTAVQRTASGAQVEVITEAGARGWVNSSSLVAFGLDRLPAVDGPADAAEPVATAAATVAATAAATATQAAPSPTPTNTPTPAPTATPTQPPTPTPLPSPTPRPAAAPAAPVVNAAGGQLAVVGMAGTTLHDAPDGEEVAQLAPADTLTVIARDATGAWLYATSSAGDKGWTLAENLVVFGVESLPVVGAAAEASPAPAAEAATTEETAAATAAETATGTVTETVTGTAAATAAATAAPAGEERAAAGGASAQVNADGVRLNVRSGPGASYRVVGKAADGEVLPAAGRDAAGDWVRVERADLPGGGYRLIDRPGGNACP